MTLDELKFRYREHYAAATTTQRTEAAAQSVVGGEFEAVGALEYYVLKAHGVMADHFVVDVGCGTGRLAVQLARRGYRRYAGFDLIKWAVEDARRRCQRPEWTFAEMDGVTLPLGDAVADCVCFFSVLTHVSHEHSFLLLREANRVLQPGGIVLLTFLEFAIPSHWTQFESAVRTFGTSSEPIVFLDRAAIAAFANRFGMRVLGLVDGDKPTFPIDEPIVHGDGRVLQDRGYLGQSLGILQKPG